MKLLKHDFVAVLNYSGAFKEPPPADMRAFIKKYPTDILLLQLSKLNAIIYREDTIENQTERGLREVIFRDVPDGEKMISQVLRLTSPNGQGIFSGASLAYLIKNCLENYVQAKPDLHITTLQFGWDLFKTILIFNQSYYASLGGEELQTFPGLFKLDIVQQYYIRRERDIKYIVMLKFAFISKYFSEDPLLKSYCLEYCRKFGLGTLWGIGQFFLHIYQLLQGGDPEQRHIIDKNGQDYPILELFVLHKRDLENRSRLSLHLDVIPKPFYELDDQHLLLLDFNFFNYSLDQGVFYSLYHNSSLPTNLLFKTFAQFKSYLALHYYEQHFIDGLIRQLFSKRNQVVISTDDFQDFIVRANNNDVFIFEVKTGDIHPNVIEQLDFPGFKKFLDDNFLADKSAGSSKNKGIVQLIRQIKHLAAAPSELLQKLGLKDAGRLTIYPVIIYADPNLDMSGVNAYINESFLPKIAGLQTAFQAIKPVIMLNGATLLNYFHLLKNDPNRLAGWINDYFKSIKTLKKRYEETKGPYYYMQSNRSFSYHLSKKLQRDYLDLNISAIQSAFDLNITDFGMDHETKPPSS